VHLRKPRHFRPRQSLLAGAMMCCVACADTEPSGVVSRTTTDAAVPAGVRGVAFVLDVSVGARSIRVTPPSRSSTAAPQIADQTSGSGSDDRPLLSLLGSDVIEVRATNYAETPAGASVSGKVLVTFDLTIVNRFAALRLVTPTYPLPPDGVSGVQAFPFDIAVTASVGGVAESGGQIVVTAPSGGGVTASSDWDGAPHNFFSSEPCSPAQRNCFRYEPFGVIGSAGRSEARRVGFLIDPGVTSFQSKVILAADLEPAAP